MKHSNLHSLVLALLTFIAGSLYAGAPEFQVRPPNLDADARFWVYRNGRAQPPMPFAPYGWMSDVTNLTQLIQIDVDCQNRPNTVSKPANSSEKERCLRMKITWDDATWASVAFISGPDKPPWWGEANRGRYFNLGTLGKKRLVFYARGERGGECIKAQIGTLGDKPFGDSLSKPIITEEMKLTQDWSRHEIDLKDVPSSDLARICNGFAVLAERGSQTGSPSETQFYLDDIYFE